LIVARASRFADRGWVKRMSVLVEAVTVVIRCDAIERSFPGAMLAFAENVPNRTFRTDGRLVAVGFMTHDDAEVYVNSLGMLGLRLAEQGKYRDVAVIDDVYGPILPCDWIELGADSNGTRFAWLHGTSPGEMVAPTWWRPGMLVRTDRMPDLQVDPDSGHRFFIDETGSNLYLGEAYGEDDPKTRELHKRRRLLGVAMQSTCDALLRREWLFLTYFLANTADFHVVMRYRNQLGLVFVAANRGTTTITALDRAKKERLLARAREFRGVAIVARCELAPADEDASEANAPTVQSLDFEDASIGTPLREDKLDTQARIEISDWEILGFAIAYVREQMENNGYDIEYSMSEELPGPHILARKDGTVTRVVVSAARFPAETAVFDHGRLRTVAEATLNTGGTLATAGVVLAHADDPFTGEDVLQLCRGDPIFVRYKGLEFLDPNRVLARPSKGFSDHVKALIRSTWGSFAGKSRGSSHDN
jgi:hypothetical protein